MRERKRWGLGVVLLVAAAVLIVPAVVAAGPDSSATVRFGNADAGTGIPPPVGHDSSANATST